jgi:hypothetical protein
VPFGEGAANETFTLDFWGANVTRPISPAPNVAPGSSTARLVMPHKLFAATCTLHTATGIDGCDVTSDERFCDDLGSTFGTAFATALAALYGGVEGTEVVVANSASVDVAYLYWPDFFGFEYIIPQVTGVGGGGIEADAANFLYALYSPISN